METAVRKATRLEYLPPKLKHLTTLKNLTLEDSSCIDNIMLSLEKRLKERSWIITYKVLVIVHYLMREGNSSAVIESVMRNPNVLDSSRIKNKTSAPASVQNIYLYRAYLDERIVAFRNLKRDFVKESRLRKEGRLRHLSVSEGLLKETPALQRQIENVLKCKFYMDEKDPAITLFAYRMTIEDLLALFQAVNEGVVNILEHYFEMNKTDAVEALKIYKRFAQQTESTITYLKEAKKYQNDLQMDIPAVNHAPLSLATALEEYLNDDTPAENEQNTTHQTQAAPLQTSPQYINQPVQQQQQPFFSQQPLFSPSAYQPQLQTNFYDNNNNEGYDQFINSFTSQPQQITASPTQSSNPFMNTNPQQGFGVFNQNNVMRSNTFSVASSSVSNNNHNPFRSLSISGNSHYQQPSQLVPVVKPAPFQSSQTTGTINHHNPFSPVTPPLTPNNQPFYNNNGTMSFQQQQQSSTSNPFLTH